MVDVRAPPDAAPSFELREPAFIASRPQGVREVAPVSKSGDKSTRPNRVPTGIPGFDELIEGGFEERTNTLLAGYAGTGKTTFSMQFLYNGITLWDEPGVYLSFAESKESIYRHCNSFGWDFYALEKQNMVRHLYYKAHQVNKLLEEGGGTVRDTIAEIGAKRLVIDSITAYGLLFRDDYKQREALLLFFEMLVKWGCTSLIIAEQLTGVVDARAGEIGFLTDGIVSFSYSRSEDDLGSFKRRHTIEILKMRGTDHYNGVAEMLFTKQGLTIKVPQ
ncbi:MAG: ATPase domain-containing protein [Candidatus Diapherotrites archaeon]|nr:ATPase domain-containing protein [Candidatus Diapherotrites archaeon]MDZ4256304.1 ATPase domain-containing protein [archaeon]